MIGRILERIWQLTEPTTSAGNWPFLELSAQVRRRSGDPKELIDALRAEFSIEDLLDARVFVKGRQDEPQLSPRLGDPSTNLLFLYREPNQSPFEIVGRSGCLTSDDLPCFSSREDYDTRLWCEHADRLLLTISSADLAVLRQLRLPATSAAGLDKIDFIQAHRLFDIPNPSIAVRQKSPDRYGAGTKLTLVDWRVAAMAGRYPKQLSAILARLRDVQIAYRVDITQRIDIWRPTREDIAEIKLAVDNADAKEVHELVSRSATRSLLPIGSRATTVSESPTAYSAARRELIDLLASAEQGLVSPDQLRSGLDKLRRAFRLTFIERTIDAAELSSNSILGAVALATVSLMDRLHNTSDLALTATAASKGQLGWQNGVSSEDTIKETLQIISGLTRAVRTLT